MLRYIERPVTGAEFERPQGMPDALYRLLLRRGISSAAEAEAYLHPSRDQLNDPMLLNDMAKAVSRIRAAVAGGERICVYGDYDVDGVSASAIMHFCFERLNVEAEIYIPSRHDEGYGLNEHAVRELAERTDLMITVDCGIASAELVALAKELGMDCIVTDHHRPGEILPPCPVINPLLNGYPCPWLCGAGVALKLTEALLGREEALELIDIAAIATIADIVPLTGENRVITALGLKKKPRTGIRALMDAASLKGGYLSAENVAFQIAPRLNAGGRLGSARRSYEMLIQQDEFLATAQADELQKENVSRQEMCRKIEQEVALQLKDFDFSAHRILLLKQEGWNRGVIGISASHIKEAYGYPVIVFSQEDGMLTGSARSIEGVDMYALLSSASDLMERFGGHAMAAGCSLPVENFEALQKRFDEYLFENTAPELYIPSKTYDITISMNEINEELVDVLRLMEPTGRGNETCVLRVRAKIVEANVMGKAGEHLSLTLSEDGQRLRAVCWRAGSLLNTLGDEADVLCSASINEFRGRRNVELQLSSIRNPDILSRMEHEKESEVRILRRFLTELFYNKRIDLPGTAAPVSMDALRERLTDTKQGTLILCGDFASAYEIASRFGDLISDVYVGGDEIDPRLYNCVCVCPERTDTFPAALRALVLCGVPALKCEKEQLMLSVPSALEGLLPDVDEMRSVYKAALVLQKQGVRPVNEDAFYARVMEETGLNDGKIHLSMLTLIDMELIRVEARPYRVVVPAAQKTDPDSSALWREICRLRREH